ncbi:MAG: arginine decarboxylase, pyruvoyl-dependent [candidate division Zixibacteria bacterium]|nr:arginine decarboxylase, pyruvoyl-dependent [Candidatus Tariuqbacter arcticus]
MIDEPPEYYFLAVGASEGLTPLNAFDGALVAAGIGQFNLVKVTSIVPPNAEQADSIPLKPGTVVPSAFAAIHSVTPDEIITAAVSVAIPQNGNQHGLIMEYSARGHKSEVEEIVRNMAEEGMKLRGFQIKSLKSLAIEHKVERIGCVIAAVLLW